MWQESSAFNDEHHVHPTSAAPHGETPDLKNGFCVADLSWLRPILGGTLPAQMTMFQPPRRTVQRILNTSVRELAQNPNRGLSGHQSTKLVCARQPGNEPTWLPGSTAPYSVKQYSNSYYY